ncbi:hypothetical protein AB6E30_06625 [Vibrio sp. 10N.247.311.12]|uniref:hypothetical protein n=1 Tax=Vibrio sp. 10N.247.311.12 TaxID=3229991 RepID=UPI00354D4BB6
MVNSYLDRILLFSIFFQAVGFFPGIDTQPNFILLCLILFPFIISRLVVSAVPLSVLFILTCSLLAAFLFHVDNITLKTALTYLAPVFIAYAIFILNVSGCLNLSTRFLLIVVFIYSFVGVCQFIKPDFLSFLVTRSVDAALSFSESGRGVRSLTGEPAHFGKIITIINVFFVLTYAKEKGMKFNTYDVNYILSVSLFLLLINVLVPRSFYSIFNHALVFYFLIVFFRPKLSLVILVSFVSILLVWGASLSFIDSDVRFVNILNYMLNEPQRLLDFGAFRRVMNIPLTFYNLSFFGPYGAGDSDFSIYTSFSTPLGELYYNVFGRLYGGVFEYTLKFGVFSIPILACVLLLMCSALKLRVFVNGQSSNLGGWLLFALFLILFQDGAPAKPLPIFLLIYTYCTVLNLRRGGEVI